jgi:hypothetical protein
MPTTVVSESHTTSKFFSASPYRSFSFLLNTACGLALLIIDAWMIVRRWNTVPQDVITFMAFWIAVVAIIGPFVTYMRTYSELHTHCQAVMGSDASDSVGSAVLIAERALDTQMLQYYGVVFTVILCLAKVFQH